MAVAACGLATILVDEGREMKLVRADPVDTLHRAAFFKPCIDEVSKFSSGASIDTSYDSNNDSGEVLSFTSKHLRQFTDNFDVNKRMGPTQFGVVYRGKIELGKMSRNVVVKIWDERADDLENLRVPYIFVHEEVRFLKDKAIASHPYIVKVIGKCCEEKLRGIVYDLDPLDTVHNMMMKDNFNWAQRITSYYRYTNTISKL